MFFLSPVFVFSFLSNKCLIINAHVNQLDSILFFEFFNGNSSMSTQIQYSLNYNPFHLSKSAKNLKSFNCIFPSLNYLYMYYLSYYFNLTEVVSTPDTSLLCSIFNIYLHLFPDLTIPAVIISSLIPMLLVRDILFFMFHLGLFCLW